MKAHHQGIDDLDLRDVFLQDLRPCALVPFEAELHVFRRQRVAVVKLQSRPQLELVRLAVRALLPQLREAWAHLVPGIRPDERIVDRIEHAERRDLRRRGGRIEPARRDRHVPGDRDFARRGRHGGRGGHRAKGCDCAEQKLGQKSAKGATQVQDLERSHENLPSGKMVTQLERCSDDGLRRLRSRSRAVAPANPIQRFQAGTEEPTDLIARNASVISVSD